MAGTVHVALVGGDTEHIRLDMVLAPVVIQLRWTAYEAAIACDGVPYQNLAAALAGTIPAGEDDAAVAAAAEGPDAAAIDATAAVDAIEAGREALGRDEVRWIQNRPERGFFEFGVELEEHADDGRFPVVVAESAEELGVGDDAAPALADKGDAGERGRPRGQAQEYLYEEVVVVHRRRRRRVHGVVPLARQYRVFLRRMVISVDMVFLHDFENRGL
jgi:hypothetical protein